MLGLKGIPVLACHFKLHVGTKFPATELGVWRSAISGRSMAETARKRAEQAQAQTETTIMLVWLVVYLGLLGLVYEVFGQ